ncbi:hypothetical protein JL720_4556 [Aureococcus anophagefferens]|nr:hypothetical protein JL720_4556 [Aureococcus anophagefferens]
MDYGYAQNYGNFYYNPDGHISGSLPALNIDTNTLSDGFTWSEYLAAKTYTDGLYISGMSYDGRRATRSSRTVGGADGRADPGADAAADDGRRT